MQFVLNHWYLFLALVVVLALLVAPNFMQVMHGIKSLTPAQSVLSINRESAVVIDVCEPSEYAGGHVPNAVNVPLSSLAQRLTSLNKYKERPLILVCRSGNRALKAATTLRKSGFPAVYIMAGGQAAWEKENLPLEK